MARPQILQKLQHGKLICKSVFNTFVETYNWVVDSWSNLRGDFDENPQRGYIEVDRTNQDHPVLRLHINNLPKGGGGGSGSVIPGCFELGEVSPSNIVTVSNCYFRRANITVAMSNVTQTVDLTGHANDVLMLKVGATTDNRSQVSFEFSSLQNLIDNLKDDLEWSHIPLYKFTDYAPTIDFRKTAIDVSWEA